MYKDYFITDDGRVIDLIPENLFHRCGEDNNYMVVRMSVEELAKTDTIAIEGEYFDIISYTINEDNGGYVFMIKKLEDDNE